MLLKTPICMFQTKQMWKKCILLTNPNKTLLKEIDTETAGHYEQPT